MIMFQPHFLNGRRDGVKLFFNFVCVCYFMCEMWIKQIPILIVLVPVFYLQYYSREQIETQIPVIEHCRLGTRLGAFLNGIPLQIMPDIPVTI